MSTGTQEAETRTLDHAIRIVAGHAQLLANMGEALRSVDRPDPDFLTLARKRAKDAADELWDIESTWGLGRRWTGPEGLGQRLHHTLYVLPLIVVALDHALEHPDRELDRHGPAWVWAMHAMEDTASDFRAWLDAQAGEASR